MTVVTSPDLHVTADALAGLERDTLRLTWEERRWTRKRVRTTAGREIALALPTGSLLRPGAILAVEDGWYLAVEAREEPVILVRPRSRDEAVRVAFEVGNRHFPLALADDALLVPADTAMVQLFKRLDVPWERRDALFDPIGRPAPSGDGLSPLDGHAHHHDG